MHCSRVLLRAAAEAAPLKRTPLHALHASLGAKFVGFCGWDMPVLYDNFGVLNEHKHTRASVGLFDVSHMGQLKFTGKDAIRFLEQLVVADVANQTAGSAKLSVFTLENGGILDDTMISRYDDHVYVVINAGCFDKDMVHIRERLAAFRGDVHLEVLSETHALIAVQGPKAEQALQPLTSIPLRKLYFMNGVASTSLAGVPNCRVTRCGYTGEDGFEVAIPFAHAEGVARKLLASLPGQGARFIGLGARDSLRMEAGLCLYGNDIDSTTNPVEAGLAWTIAKRRRAEGGFLGADKILPLLRPNVVLPRRRVGIVLESGVPRAHAVIETTDGQKVGELSSGGFGPTLGKGCGMAYMPNPMYEPKTRVQVVIRDKRFPASVTKLPLVPTQYYNPPK